MEREHIIQYVGYCSDEAKRSGRKLYSTGDTEYPLIDAGITTEDALKICQEHGFDFGGVYEHHQHFNCWLCPLQKVHEVEWIIKNEPDKWDRLRKMQWQTDGYYNNGRSIFEYEERCWKKEKDNLERKRMIAREKYNQRGKKNG